MGSALMKSANKDVLLAPHIKYILFIWIVIVYLYSQHVPIDHCGNDFWQHLEYTEIIVKQHRLPQPYEKFSTFHPPLYYIFASFISPKSLGINDFIHVNQMRIISVICGGIFLLIINWFMFFINKNPVHRLLILLFIATTPKFIFMFSTYNNDVFTILLGVLLFFIGYKLYLNWSWKLASLLVLVGTAGFYTKYNYVVPVGIVFSICLINFLRRKSLLAEKRMLVLLPFCLIFFLPWLIFHNLQYSGELLPANHDIHAKIHMESLPSYINIVLPTAIFQNFFEKWSDPFGHTWGGPSSKKFDYWACEFLSSINQGGEFKVNLNIIWIMFYSHLIAYILGFKEIFKSKLTKLAGFIILLDHTYMILRFLTSMGTKPFEQYPGENASVLDYRYIGWEYLAWAILYASIISNHKTLSNKLIKVVLVVGILIQIYFLLTISGPAC